MKRVLKKILHASVYLLVVLVVTYFIITFVGQKTVVTGNSMEPTLANGDNLLINKFIYKKQDPLRFDIIVFPSPYEKKEYLIKRVIGLPGEDVRIDEAGNIYINETLLEESYGKDTIADPGLAIHTIHLSEDEFFVLGDNRNDSLDSRFAGIGLVKRQFIVGEAGLRIYPFSKINCVK